MAQVLPATVEELNMTVPSAYPSYKKGTIGKPPVMTTLKREVSLPNGVENWNIGNLEQYLIFDDPVADFDFGASPDDRTVPGEDQRPRCESTSSFCSSIPDEKQPLVFSPVKPFNSVLHMSSGSTCVAADHSYFSPSSSLSRSFDMEETYANIGVFFQNEMTDLKVAEPLLEPFSPLPSTSNDDIFELTTKSVSSEDSIESLSFRSLKRPLESMAEDDVFQQVKQTKTELPETFGPSRYHEIRRKNNLASKNCRKTRKEKQKEMEDKVSQLEEEREDLKSKVNLLEQLIEAHKKCLLSAIAMKST